jgi:hypothetical protein
MSQLKLNILRARLTGILRIQNLQAALRVREKTRRGTAFFGLDHKRKIIREGIVVNWLAQSDYGRRVGGKDHAAGYC